MSQIFLSRKKADEIRLELNELNSVRPEILKQIDEAIQLGDLSENAEYIEAKKKLRENDKRCLELNNILNNAIISNENEIKKDYIDIFAKVTLKDINNGIISEYSFVSEEEASILNNQISITSPLGNILNHKKVNDIVELNAPNGISKYQVIDIKY